MADFARVGKREYIVYQFIVGELLWRRVAAFSSGVLVGRSMCEDDFFSNS